MKTYRIGVYPGDGIGPDVVREAMRVMGQAQESIGGFVLETEWLPWGGEYYREHGCVVPEGYLETLLGFDAIFLGAVGDPARVPDEITLAPLVQIRQRFDQYACVRPCRRFEGVRSPLARSGAIDLVVVRENSEGEYAVCGGRVRTGEPEEVAIQSAVHTRRGVERILRFGFETAMRRRRRLTMITKSNALRYGMVMWDEVLERVRGDYPDVEAERQHADAAAMNLVRQPDRFDVIVGSNLFGDILSDLAGVVTGGLGLAPSANINPERRFPSLFEPVHGSAPDIVGKGIANPVAAILSAAMMLDWLDVRDAGEAIRTAVAEALAAGHLTRDLGGGLATGEMTDRILERLVGGGS
jgi:tartrate dehydrogenase/decarboxylase/D-malate dehydrogenase